MAFTSGSYDSTHKDANGFWLVDTGYSSTQNSATNSSSVTDGLQLRHASAGMFSSWALTRWMKVTYTVNGGATQTKYFFGNGSTTISNSQSMPNSILALESGTVTIPHNSDGTQTITITAWVDANTNATFVPVNTTASRTITLPTIPPAAPAPTAPTSLTATGNELGVTLNWSGATGSITNYGIWYSGTPTGAPSDASTPDFTSSSTTYTDTGMAIGGTRWYWVRAQGPGGNSSWYPATGTGIGGTRGSATPATPTYLNTYPNLTSVGLDYSLVSNATLYGIYASTSATDIPSAGTTPTFTSSYVGADYAYGFHTGLTTGSVYYYWVRAQNGSAYSAWYPAGNGKYGIAATAPSVVTGVNANQQPGDTSVDVTWVAPNYNGSPITGYELQMATNSSFVNASTISTTTNSYNTGLLIEGQTYYFRVRASNDSGQNGTENWQGTWSEMAYENIMPVFDFPSSPTSPTVNQVPDNISVYFNWDVPTDDGGGAITGYNGQYATSSSFTNAVSFTTTASSTEYTTTDLVIGQTYYFRVRATNARGDSPYTSTVSITVAPLSVPSSEPTSVGMSQLPTFLAALLTWSPPLDDGGDEVDGYMVHFANNPDFIGHTSVTLGLQYTYGFYALTEDVTYYAKVYALNNAGYSIASDVASVTILPLTADLDEWSAFGTLPTGTTDANAPEGVVRKVILDVPTAALSLHKEVTATATGGSYTIGSTGIQKTINGLIPGKQYRLSGRAVLTAASAQINNYRLQVAGVGNGTAVTLSGTTLLQTIPNYEFIATSTNHDIQIAVAEDLTIATTGILEAVAFNQISLVEVGTDSPYRLQDTVLSASLADHFDLATRSVGAAWWVDKNNKTKFASSFEYAPLAATFSDTDSSSNLNYSDIRMTLRTKDIVNDVVLRNSGTKQDVDRPKERIELNTSYGLTNDISIDAWGTRRLAIDTNLYTQPLIENLCYNPSFEYGTEGVNILSNKDYSSFNRIKIDNAAQGTTGLLATGTEAPVNGDWALAMRVIAGATATTFDYGFGVEGNDEDTDSQLGFPITPATQYTASLYAKAGINQVTGRTTQIKFRYYDASGAFLSDSSFSSATAVSQDDWIRNYVTATSPAGAYYAQIFFRINTSTLPTTVYVDNVQMNTGTLKGYVDGDIRDNDVYLYEWTGNPGNSLSREMNNILDERAQEILSKFAEPKAQISSIIWNAQQSTTIATNLDIGSRINIEFKGVTASYRIIGITHDVSPERWIMEIGVEKL